MKRIKIMSVAILLFLFPILSLTKIEAVEDTGSISIIYTPEKLYKKVQLKVEVQGNGTVYDQQQSIRNGQVLYQMWQEDSKSFQVQVDTGYIIKEIRYNDGYQIHNLLQGENTNITLQLKDKDARLVVTFIKKPIAPTDPIITPDVPSTNPALPIENTSSSKVQVSTGDYTPVIGFSIMMVFSLLCLIACKYNKKDGSNKRNES